MEKSLTTAGKILAGPVTPSPHNANRVVKVTFPLFPHHFSRLKQYLAECGLPLNFRNEVTCSLRVTRDTVSLYLNRPTNEGCP